MDKFIFDKPGTMLFPIPAIMVSCGSTPETQNILTIAWTGIINSEPPMTYISVRKSRHSHKILLDEREFVINLTTRDLAFATDYCGVTSGTDVNKFAQMGLTPTPGQQVRCPLIAESPLNLECKVTQIIELGSHDMFMAEILAVHGDKGLLDETGKFCLEKAGLLAYSHGSYYGLGKEVGSFGYSIMKKKTKKKRAVKKFKK
ncbi:MAG: flavin reductase family protein [Anaerovorax sp.]